MTKTYDELLELITEASHGKLKFDFRRAYDTETGHALKIIYSLKDINVTRVGDGSVLRTNGHADEEDRKRRVSEVQKNIARKGNMDHASTGQKVLAIVDRVTGKNFKPGEKVVCCGPYTPGIASGELKLGANQLKYIHGKDKEFKDRYFNTVTVGKIDNNSVFKSTFWPKKDTKTEELDSGHTRKIDAVGGKNTAGESLYSGRGIKLNNLKDAFVVGSAKSNEKQQNYKKESALSELMLESWIIPLDNYIINFEEWKPGNPLFITGASGDGKSTLARKLGKEYNATVISSDIVLLRVCKSQEKWNTMIQKFQPGDVNTDGTDFGDNIGMDYVNLHPELPFGLQDPITKKFDKEHVREHMIKFYEWFMAQTTANSKYNKTLYIMEGCNICQLPSEIMATKPLIVVGGSRLRALIHRIKRNKSEKGKGVLESLFKYIKMYTTVQKPLDDEKDMFLKGLKSFESAEYMDYLSSWGIIQELLK